LSGTKICREGEDGDESVPSSTIRLFLFCAEVSGDDEDNDDEDCALDSLSDTGTMQVGHF